MSTQVIQLLNEIDDDIIWFKDNFENLKKSFDNQFIAIKNGKILASDKNVENVIKTLKKKNEDPNNVIIQFVSSIPMVF